MVSNVTVDQYYRSNKIFGNNIFFKRIIFLEYIIKSLINHYLTMSLKPKVNADRKNEAVSFSISNAFPCLDFDRNLKQALQPEITWNFG